MSIHLELVTPERVVFRQDVDEVVLPTTLGEIAVLPGHVPMVASLVPGIARFKKGRVEEDVAVSGGFIEIMVGNQVRVLADTADRATELDVSQIEAAKYRAEQVMAEAVRSDDAAFAAAAAALERELARYRVARKHAGKHIPTIDASMIPDDENAI